MTFTPIHIPMRAHLKYASYVARHKWWVLVAGFRVGPGRWWRWPAWIARLLVHDWSKLLPSEWRPYALYFNGESKESFVARHWASWCSAGCVPSIAEVYAGADWEHQRELRQQAFDRAWLLHQHRQPHHWQFWLLLNDSSEDRARYHITSLDGGLAHHALTEYGRGEPPISAELSKLEISRGPEADERYRMVKRCTEAANARRPVPLEMPGVCVREMVADWMGAGRASTGRWDVHSWFAKNQNNILLHPRTRALVDALLESL